MPLRVMVLPQTPLGRVGRSHGLKACAIIRDSDPSSNRTDGFPVSGFPSRFIASIRHPRLWALALRYNVRWSFRLSVAFVSLASHHHVLHSVAACANKQRSLTLP